MSSREEVRARRRELKSVHPGRSGEALWREDSSPTLALFHFHFLLLPQAILLISSRAGYSETRSLSVRLTCNAAHV